MKKIFSFLIGVLMIGFVYATDVDTGYTILMQSLDTAHKKIIDVVAQQEKKVSNNYALLKESLGNDYAYMSLHCLGIMNLQYSGNSSVKTELFNHLLKLNTTIYKYKLGLSIDEKDVKEKDDKEKDDKEKIIKDIKKLIDVTLSQESKKIYSHYDLYKKEVIRDIKLYVEKNQSLILPLVNKMKFIDDVNKKYKNLSLLTKNLKKSLLDDLLLTKIDLLKGKLRLVFANAFDMSVKSKITANNGVRIAKIKEQYLSDFDKDFDALYRVLLSSDMYDVNHSALQKFLSKYYTKNMYQCGNLLLDTSTFSLDQQELTKEIKVATEKFAIFSKAVKIYQKKSKSEQNILKVNMIKKLKSLMDEYTGRKLRAALLKVGF